jgi:Fic family protein
VLGAVGGASWQPSRDAQPWIEFCLTAHINQATTLLKRTKELERIWDELERVVEARALPERVIYALSDATLGYKVRNATYRPIAGVSDQVASRDLKLLVDAGLLVPTGEKRGRVYAASDLLRDIRRRTREPQPHYLPPLPRKP